MRERGIIGGEGSGLRISRDIITALRAPEVEAQLQVERSLDRLVQSYEAQAPGLVLNLCMELTGTTGEPLAVHEADIIARLRPKYPDAQIQSVLEQLTALGMLRRQDGVLRLQGGVLSKLIHANVQAQTAELQKIEAFIANRYDYYLEKEQLLSEQDINYISPYTGDIVLGSGPKEFIDKSQQAIKKQKRRGAMVLASVISILSVLSIIAVFFAIRAQQQSARATREANNARIEENKARAKEMEATIAAANALKAEKAAAAARDSLRPAVLELEQANKQIRGLLEKVTDESNVAKMAQRLAEEQREVAKQRAAEIEKLNKDLNIYAGEKERDAKVARDAEVQATEARKTSEELRNILLSRIVAQRSLAMKEGDEDLKAYTAMLAYSVNADAKTSGDISHPDVFRATYYAAKSLGSSAIQPVTRVSGGAIGSIICENNTCITGSSDGTIVQFVINQNSGSVQSEQRVFYYPHDAIHFVFPQKATGGAQGSLFVLGAFDHILEVSQPAGVSDAAITLGKIELPEKQFVKSATRISDEELLIQATDGSVYRFNCAQRQLKMLLDPSVGVVASAVLPEQNLMCFATVDNELYLDNIGSDRLRETRLQYAKVKKRVAQMQLRQYGDITYLAVGYLDGELEVFIAKDQAFLNVYRSRSQGKGGFQIQSLRSSVHTGFIPEMVFAETKPMLAVCSYDGTVSVWDLRKWEERSGDYQPLILDDHDDWVTSCAFLPGDNAMLTGTKIGTVKFWYLDTAKYADGLCNGIRRSPTDDEWNEYIGEGLKNFKGKFCSGK